MAKRKAFLVRLDPAILESLQRWAADDLRSEATPSPMARKTETFL